METVLRYIRNPKYLSAIILSIVVLTTTFVTYLPDKLDMIAIYMPQLIMCLYAVFLLVLYLRKSYCPKYAAKGLFVIIVTFSVYYVFITGYRFISGGNPMQSAHTAIITFTSVILFFLVDTNIIDKKEALTDLIIVFTAINIMQVIMGFVIGSIRSSTVLQNIMVYDSVMLLMVPCLFYITQNMRKLKLTRVWGILSWINLFFILIFIPASGSRSGIIMLFVTFLLSMIINYRRNTRFLIKCTILYILVAIIIFVLYSYNMMDFKTAAMRQMLIFSDEPDEQAQVVTKDEEEAINDFIDNEKREHQKFVKSGITSSDNVRSILWDKSIEELRKSPILGTGIMLFEMQYGDTKLFQGSHNIILETSLAFGMIGMIIFFIMLGTPVSFILLFPIRYKSKTLIREILNYILSIGNIFVMAMVQPVFIMALPVMLIWLITGIMYKRCIDFLPKV